MYVSSEEKLETKIMKTQSENVREVFNEDGGQIIALVSNYIKSRISKIHTYSKITQIHNPGSVSS